MALYGHNLQSDIEDVISIDRDNQNVELLTSGRNQRALMEVLQKITCIINDTLTAEEALQLCVASVCHYTGWIVGHACTIRRQNAKSPKSASVWCWLARTQYPYLRGSAESKQIETLPCLLERVLKEKRAIYIADSLNEPQFQASEAARNLAIRSVSGFPIWTGKDIGGVLQFFSDKDMECDALLSGLLMNVGLQLGRVVERTRAEQSISRLSASLLRTQDEERRRLARELHDSTGQNLVGIKIKLAGILKTLRDRSKIGAELSDCCELVDECLKEIRTISHLLHPPLLDELGLAAAVRCYAKGFAERSRVEVTVSVDPGLDRIDRDIELAFFRVVQEALTNIHRHSGSHTARIKIGCSTNDTFVEISDSGKGMSHARVDPWGNVFGKMGVGIASMRERLHELKGRLQISSTVSGTIVRASVPRWKSRSETRWKSRSETRSLPV